VTRIVSVTVQRGLRLTSRVTHTAPAGTDNRAMQRLLLVAGAVLLVVGLLWPWLARLPWGRLPGDVHVERDGFQFFAPITTGLVISIVVSLLLWWWRR
jgi:hypothetical protein